MFTDSDKDEIPIISDKDIEFFVDKCKPSQLHLTMKYLIDDSVNQKHLMLPPPDLRQQVVDISRRLLTLETTVNIQTHAINSLKRQLSTVFNEPMIVPQLPRTGPIVESSIADWVVFDFQEDCFVQTHQRRTTRHNLSIQKVVPTAPSMPYVKPTKPNKKANKKKDENNTEERVELDEFAELRSPKDHWLNRLGIRSVEGLKFPPPFRPRRRTDQPKSNNESNEKVKNNTI